ncbi:hypothetical protein AB0N17_41830 [Streptomyces sp. NPDC051133]|uniref:tetratricopeptide repeat protein n=1 Tax=Streptomyces sp. NPDC051133 TaxID=3155521 RepID=UPI00341DAF24
MNEREQERGAALVELRKRLTDGLARTRLSKTQLAVQARLGRTTVQAAFQAGASAAPSAETVVALARVLRLPEKELLDLRRAAAEETEFVGREGKGLGKPICDWDPHDLEVHPAGAGFNRKQPGVKAILSGYVTRDHDQVLAEVVRDALEGRSRMVVLVGSSSTGKTRACWEAVQPMANRGWRLWHPFDPTRGAAALEGLLQVQPCTVVWLNEAQHYLGSPQVGEQIAAAIHSLLTDPTRGPILVLGTLWPEYADEYATLPSPGGPDRFSRSRELLAGRTLVVPEYFDEWAMREAASLARSGDLLLADALTRAAAGGRVAQDLAGAPELLRRYEQSVPAARAVLEAAMDARRLGSGLHLPQAFLIDAAVDYLTDEDFTQLRDDWAESAFADLARPVHGNHAPLRRTGARPERRPPGSSALGSSPATAASPKFRLADYLEQHGRKSRRGKCPPASFWHAALVHLTLPEDLNNLAKAAEDRHRLQWAYHLRHRAAESGDPSALVHMGGIRMAIGDREGAQDLYWQATKAGIATAWVELANICEQLGGREQAQALYQQAVDKGDLRALRQLTLNFAESGNWEEAEAVASQAPEADRGWVLQNLARQREKVGDPAEAEALFRRAADAGNTIALTELVRLRIEAGDLGSAKMLTAQALKVASPIELTNLSMICDLAGDTTAGDIAARQAAKTGDSRAIHFAVMRAVDAGDYEEAESLATPAADAGDGVALTLLSQLRRWAGKWPEAEELARKAADAGDTFGLYAMARDREKEGHLEEAAALFRQASEAGDEGTLDLLARRRIEAGDQEGADAYYLQAADGGAAKYLRLGDHWPCGLNADGTPTDPW